MKTFVIVILILLLLVGTFLALQRSSTDNHSDNSSQGYDRLICSGGLSSGDSIIKNKLREKLCK